MIPLIKPHIPPTEQLAAFFDSPHRLTQKKYTQECQATLQKIYPQSQIYFTPSGTKALELAALSIGIKPGDEIIVPSYTYLATAAAFALFGAHIKFVDVHPDTMNIDETLIEAAITEHTKAVVVVHYAGVACHMDKITQICRQKNLVLIEDNAHGIDAYYKDKNLGAFGDLSCFSFDYSKNITCGEGGALLVNNDRFREQADVFHNSGTNRSDFEKGKANQYEWTVPSSRFLLSELNAALLLPQLNNLAPITARRLNRWETLRQKLLAGASTGFFSLPEIPSFSRHNAHIFYLKMAQPEQRTNFIQFLKQQGIEAAFHYVPLHGSASGINHGTFVGHDTHTTHESRRLVRLPMYPDLSDEDINYIAQKVLSFF